ncbi:MAG: hypothetical protein LQ351_004813 [Letrouitia transgressa]|nr:MAG: hypothetical protein LQ351_004813 [Letrouitia transgressa]
MAHPPLQWLSTLKLAQLKHLARATGINSSGTKPILSARIHDEILHSRAPPSTDKKKKNATTTILSVDMGIRNLAFCCLALKPPTTASAPRAAIPTVTSWSRIALLPSSSSSSSSGEGKEDPFSPPALAATAHALITDTFLPLAPTHILIERQRFRSLGAASVQEWTLRVNMLEAMLHAVLRTLGACGGWKGQVVGMAPGKVTQFWLGDGREADADAEEARGKGKGSKSARTKRAKVAVVGQWLRHRDSVVEFREELNGVVEGYLRRMEGRKGAVEGEEGMGKLDDLADCLLQGMAWVRWEENRSKVLSKGPDVLGELGLRA